MGLVDGALLYFMPRIFGAEDYLFVYFDFFLQDFANFALWWSWCVEILAHVIFLRNTVHVGRALFYDGAVARIRQL